jgi:hypothetical protein
MRSLPIDGRTAHRQAGLATVAPASAMHVISLGIPSTRPDAAPVLNPEMRREGAP